MRYRALFADKDSTASTNEPPVGRRPGTTKRHRGDLGYAATLSRSESDTLGERVSVRCLSFQGGNEVSYFSERRCWRTRLLSQWPLYTDHQMSTRARSRWGRKDPSSDNVDVEYRTCKSGLVTPLWRVAARTTSHHQPLRPSGTDRNPSAQ